MIQKGKHALLLSCVVVGLLITLLMQKNVVYAAQSTPVPPVNKITHAQIPVTSQSSGVNPAAVAGTNSNNGPGMANCGGYVYVVYSADGGTGQQVHVNKLGVQDQVWGGYTNTDLSGTCYGGVFYFAFVDPDNNHIDVAQYNSPGYDTGESSFGRPALASANGKLYLAWAGTDAQHSINFKESFGYDGHTITWGNKHTVSDTTRSGYGVSLATNGNTIYVAWAGASTPNLNFATYNGTNTLASKHTFSDTTASTPAIGYHNTHQVELLWQGPLALDNALRSATYTNGVYSGPTVWSNGTYHSPAIWGRETVFTATNGNVFYDNGKFF